MQIYHPYTEWEDWKAGMFEPTSDADRVQESYVLLRSASSCLDAMRKVVQEWPIATEVNLTDRSSNRRSWLGQAACCLAHRATERETCAAWWGLTSSEQARANRCAEGVILEWERRNAQTLFR